MDQRTVTSEQSHTLTSGQKTGFVFLLIFSVLIVAVGFLQMRNTIYNPFAVQTVQETRDIRSLVDNETLRLQSTDTDGDGLFDYDELTFYETSPYLPDTDSDGIRDNVEIDQGTDPLCPKGTECETQDAAVAAGDAGTTLIGTDVQDTIGSPLDALDVLSGESAATQPEAIPSSSQLEDTALSSYLSDADREATIEGLRQLVQNPIELRTFLVGTGQVTAEELSQISDEELLRLSKELFERQFGVTFDSSQPADTNAP